MIEGLNKHFESRVRLGIMSILMVDDVVDFNTLKERLKTSDGNLASHINTLEKNGYLKYYKEFLGKKPKTTYSATAEGRKAFEKHIEGLEKLLKLKM